MKFQLKVWRQKSQDDKGFFQSLEVKDISEDLSFLEMMDLVNQNLILKNKSQLLLIMTVEREFAALAV